MSIVIVEDDRNMKILFERYLKSFTESELHFFSESGELTDWIKNLDTTQKRNIDLMLMDIKLPDMNGIDTTKKLKSDSVFENLPILAITGLDDPDNLRKAFDAGCTDYITKPFNKIEFKARVESALRLKNALDRERELAIRDGLTGLYNRRYFNEEIEKEYARAKREETALSLILCDIDFFKQYNDTYGHTMGDETLKKVAQSIEDSIRRPGDIAARYGGEEFALILPETGEEGAFDRAETVRRNVADLEIEHKNSEVSDVLTVSVGVTTQVPMGDRSSEDLINDADEALYQVKNEGRNQVILQKSSGVTTT